MIITICAALGATACGRKEENPPNPSTSEVTFADAQGNKHEVLSCKAGFPTISLWVGPSVPITYSKAVFVGVYLSNGRVLEINYPVTGSDFPPIGSVMVTPVITVSYSDARYGVDYVNNANLTMGTLQVESTSAQLVSGTYTGPVEYGGPTMKLTFKNLKVE